MSSVMRVALSILAAGGMLRQTAFAQNAPASTGPAIAVCSINGRVTVGTTPIPGALVAVDVDGTRSGQSITDSNGAFALRLAPNGKSTSQPHKRFFNRPRAMWSPVMSPAIRR